MGDSCEGSSRVFRRRRNVYLLDNSSTKLFVRSYNRSRVPRLRWTNELHQCFVNAVQTLGGEDRATPKNIMQMMNVKGLTVSHIKSHLQMFRSIKNETILQVNYYEKQEIEEKKEDDNEVFEATNGNVDNKVVYTDFLTNGLISNHNQNDDTQIVREPIVASLSSSSVVDIELTLGGPYACL